MLSGLRCSIIADLNHPLDVHRRLCVSSSTFCNRLQFNNLPSGARHTCVSLQHCGASLVCGQGQHKTLGLSGDAETAFCLPWAPVCDRERISILVNSNKTVCLVDWIWYLFKIIGYWSFPNYITSHEKDCKSGSSGTSQNSDLRHLQLW